MWNDLVNSVIRTLVPMVVGVVVSTLADWNVTVGEAEVSSFLFAAAYYIAARVLEGFTPNAGALLNPVRPNSSPKYDS